MRATHFFMMLVSGAAMTMAVSGSAHAATINLIDWGGVKGSQSEQEFNMAANYWGSLLTNDAVINLGVSFSDLGSNTVGATDSYKSDYTIRNWLDRVAATKSDSRLDQTIVMPTLNSDGNISFIGNGRAADGGDDTAKREFIAGTTYSSNSLYLNNAVAKAIGNPADFAPDSVDGSVAFSSTFRFDFDPRDGIDDGKFDFLWVAIHEIGHALGFVSGGDYFDYSGYPNGPYKGGGWSNHDYATFSSLDMFRYGTDPDGLAPGDGPVLDLAVGSDSYFSIDGGQTALWGNSFATGAFNGDGDSPSHWKHTGPCNAFGIMDPIVCYGTVGQVKALDLAAFDAMGWNLSVDILDHPDYNRTTADIFSSAVPEPASWMMMIVGFGLIGGALRGRARGRTPAAAGL